MLLVAHIPRCEQILPVYCQVTAHIRDTQKWSSVGKHKPVASVAACVGTIVRLKEMGWLEV